MEDVMKNLSTYISCFEFDKFEPIATEYEMEEKGMNDLIVIYIVFHSFIFNRYIIDTLSMNIIKVQSWWNKGSFGQDLSLISMSKIDLFDLKNLIICLHL